MKVLVEKEVLRRLPQQKVSEEFLKNEHKGGETVTEVVDLEESEGRKETSEVKEDLEEVPVQKEETSSISSTPKTLSSTTEVLVEFSDRSPCKQLNEVKV